MNNHENLTRLIRENRLAEAAVQTDMQLASCHDDSYLWYIRGKIWWKMGNRTQAMTCYSRAVAIDPASPAASALEQAHDIADFFNPDLLNP